MRAAVPASRLVGRVPDWAWALAIYVATRVLTGVLTVLAASAEPANLWTPASPGYGDFVSMWDGDRYRTIAERGYPLPLPVDARGPTQSEWAFYPLYPLLVRPLVAAGLPFDVAGPGLSTVLGCAAALVLHRLFTRHCDRTAALAAVGLIGLFPSAPVLQYAYSEATCLLMLGVTLLYLDRGRYLAAAPAALLCGLSRPIGPALVATIVIVLAVAWRRGHRPGWDAAVLLAAAVTGTAVWPVLVGIVAGRPDGYTAVQSAWRVAHRMEYFTPWLWMSRYAFGAAGPYLLAGLVVLVVLTLAAPQTRRLGVTLWAWTACYLVFLAAVLDPFTSVIRHLLLLFPLAAAATTTLPPGRGRRALIGTVAVVLLAVQGWWIAELWLFTPPSDYPP